MYIHTTRDFFIVLIFFISWDLLSGEREISIPTRGLSLFTRRNYGLHIFWIRRKNRSITIPNGIGSSFRSNFLAQEHIEGSKLSFLMHIGQTRKNITP